MKTSPRSDLPASRTEKRLVSTRWTERKREERNMEGKWRNLKGQYPSCKRQEKVKMEACLSIRTPASTARAAIGWIELQSLPFFGINRRYDSCRHLSGFKSSSLVRRNTSTAWQGNNFGNKLLFVWCVLYLLEIRNSFRFTPKFHFQDSAKFGGKIETNSKVNNSLMTDKK